MGFGRASSSDSDMCSLPGVLRRHDVHARCERSGEVFGWDAWQRVRWALVPRASVVSGGNSKLACSEGIIRRPQNTNTHVCLSCLQQRCECRPKTRWGSQQAPCIRALAVYMVPRPDAVQQQVVAVIRVHTREEVVVPATTWCITLLETSLSPRPRGTISPRGHRSKTHVGLSARNQTCGFARMLVRAFALEPPTGDWNTAAVLPTGFAAPCLDQLSCATRGQRGPREAAQPSLSSPNGRLRKMRIAGRNTVSPNLCAVHTQSHGDTW